MYCLQTAMSTVNEHHSSASSVHQYELQADTEPVNHPPSMYLCTRYGCNTGLYPPRRTQQLL